VIWCHVTPGRRLSNRIVGRPKGGMLTGTMTTKPESKEEGGSHYSKGKAPSINFIYIFHI